MNVARVVAGAVLLVAISSQPRVKAAKLEASVRHNGALSVAGAYHLCHNDVGSQAFISSEVNVRGFEYVAGGPGGAPTAGVLYDQKLQSGSAVRHVRVQVGPGSYEFGLLLHAGGLVVVWPGSAPPGPASARPARAISARGGRIVVSGRLVCRDVYDELSHSFVNGQTTPFLTVDS